MRTLAIFTFMLAAFGYSIQSFAQSASQPNSEQTTGYYKPSYSEDTAIIRFVMKDSANVWARLYDDPIGKKRIIAEISFGTHNESALDWAELKSDLQILITKAYKNINDPNLKEEIDAEIKKTIDQQKMFYSERQR